MNLGVYVGSLLTQDVDPGSLAPHTVSPGAVGFILFAGLGLATFLLWKSMNRQLKKIDLPRESEVPRAGEPESVGADASGQPADVIDLSDNGAVGGPGSGER